MKILIIGGGGREHALAWKCAQSARVTQVFVAPGNAGTAHEAKLQNVPLATDDIPELIAFAQREAIALTIVGPEAPLVLGVVDAFLAVGLPCFGPRQDAAILEGSKIFTKEFLQRQRIPTAAYASFNSLHPACAYMRQCKLPLVIKADGLAAGKGVVIAQTLLEAEQAAREMLEGASFGKAGRSIVVEEFLQGEEASFIVMTDGDNVLPLASSQDHKRLLDGDQGPNTGGMGAYSPAPVVTPAMHQRIMDEVIAPTLRGMATEGRRYTGFLYAGVMIAEDGTPNVLEFNCRFGDPETQPIMMRLQSDLVTLCEAALNGTLAQQTAQWDGRAALAVVLAAHGYPDTVRKGDVISGLDDPLAGANDVSVDVKVFHAGTTEQDGHVITAGGRVLAVTALGQTVAQAQAQAYSRVQSLHFDGMQYRHDIGYRAINRN